ncbi:MAG: hypothetical protein WKF89_20600 [Chitinophagaceae bacterium]
MISKLRDLINSWKKLYACQQCLALWIFTNKSDNWFIGPEEVLKAFGQVVVCVCDRADKKVSEIKEKQMSSSLYIIACFKLIMVW